MCATLDKIDRLEHKLLACEPEDVEDGYVLWAVVGRSPFYWELLRRSYLGRKSSL